MSQVFLGLGANLGDVFDTFSQAHKELSAKLGSVIDSSQIYKSEPFTGLDQPTYYNLVLAFESELTVTNILSILQEVEFSLGRVRNKERWSNRLIDIDILAFGSDIINLEGLTVPHYDLARRDFFLVPLAELAPNFIHPVTKVGISAMIESIPKDLLTHLIVATQRYEKKDVRLK
ncbi:MAG: 2-amino-4-hydroxy-6-hydroxymethyldihydropteridine diphosphokinase [SAR324 cluster bacterium]|nr:2-amino-4-hydroxy-6-hydroxymethyldihydropteridine diphosphokinase [SAR324 cluster bacterium]